MSIQLCCVNGASIVPDWQRKKPHSMQLFMFYAYWFGFIGTFTIFYSLFTHVVQLTFTTTAPCMTQKMHKEVKKIFPSLQELLKR